MSFGDHAAESAPLAQESTPTRALIISDQTSLARALEHHLSIIWPDAQCRIHSPRQSGRLHPAFNAGAFDAVVLDDQAEGGTGLEWLEHLLARTEFPPVVYVVAADQSVRAERAMRLGAVQWLARERIDNAKLREALVARVAERRRRASAVGGQVASQSHFGPVKLDGYRHVQALASGGNAQVYLAESLRAGEMVVLKVLREGLGPKSTEFARFIREYELLAKIRDSNVVRILDCGVCDEHAYIAMEYFPRGDLRVRIADGMTPAQALDAVTQMAHALEVVHEVGVLHRDLKPGNVMLRADGSLALIDFGLAKYSESAGADTAAGRIFGTPYYMSPEQGHGRPLDERSDLYSLGVMLYEMLTGKKPFVASKPMAVIYMHANAARPQLDPTLAAYQPLVDRLLAVDPADRYGSASELLTALHIFRAMPT